MTTTSVKVVAALGHDWATPKELASRFGCGSRTVERAIHALGQQRIIFRRQRRSAFKQPYEYRILPEAIQIQIA